MKTIVLKLWLVLMLPLAAETWVVSPKGRDRRAGTADAPLETLAEALHRAEERKAGPAEIVLQAGVYVIDEPLEITAAHASAQRGSLTIRAEGDVTLSGFSDVRANAWKKVDARTQALLPAEVRGRVLQIPLKRFGREDPGHLSRRGFNVAEARETPPALLFISGRPMSLAHWPDDGETVAPGEVLDPGPTRDGSDFADFYKRGGTFRFDNARLSKWAAEKNLWVQGTFGYDWEWSFNRVKRIDTTARTIQLASGEVSGLLDEDWLHPGFQVVNAISEITQPGEYYLDYANQRVLLLPPADPSWKNNAAMTWTEGPLLEVSNASGLQLVGLTLEGARDDLMEIQNSSDIALKDMDFRRNGGDGLIADGKRITLAGCGFEDCGGTALKLLGGTEATLDPSGDVVDGCTFRRNAWWSKVFEPSISLEGVGHRVTDCRFEDLPHMAIEAKGNDFVIEGNLFRRVSQDFRDMGAVYFNLGENPLRRGSMVRGNFFDDIGGAGGNRSAVYLDNATMGVTVESNLFRKVGGSDADWTVMILGGGYNRVAGNVFLDCPLPVEVDFLFATWAADQLAGYQEKWFAALDDPQAAPRLAAYPELADFKQEDAVHPPGIEVEDNQVFYSTASAPGMMKIEGGDAQDVEQGGNTVKRVRAFSELPSFAQELMNIWK